MKPDAGDSLPSSETLEAFLEEVSAHMGPRRGKKDMILELRSTILDRAEEIGQGTVDDATIKAAIKAVGEPALVASAYTGEQYLIGPKLYRPFLFYTGIIFAVHLVMILVASVALTKIELFPVTILRVAPP